MSGRECIDTNVLVYADDVRDRRKQARARDSILRLMRERLGVLSLQILQEFFATATGIARHGQQAGETARESVLPF